MEGERRITPQKSAFKLPPSKKMQDQGIGVIGSKGKPGNGAWREREELLHRRVHVNYPPAKRCRIKVLEVLEAKEVSAR